MSIVLFSRQVYEAGVVGNFIENWNKEVNTVVL